MDTKKRYRYSDGNTHTDNLSLAKARYFQRVQNGGTITPMRNYDLAKKLRSAASALERGRKSSASAKLCTIAEELSKVEAMPVIFMEGGLVRDVIVVDPKAKDGCRDLTFEIVDYDAVDESVNPEDAATMWDGFSDELKAYFALPRMLHEREKFLAAVRECSKCQNCGGVWATDTLHSIEHYSERVADGEPEPSGECPSPDCGALCHEMEAY